MRREVGGLDALAAVEGGAQVLDALAASAADPASVMFQPVSAFTRSSHGSPPGQHREHAQTEAVHHLVRVAKWACAMPLPSVPFHLTFVSFGSTAFGSENFASKVSFHDAEPAVWRPGVGSAM